MSSGQKRKTLGAPMSGQKGIMSFFAKVTPQPETKTAAGEADVTPAEKRAKLEVDEAKNSAGADPLLGAPVGGR